MGRRKTEMKILDSCDFSGKTIVPFNTHEGSGQSYTVRVDTFNENGITEGTVYQTI